MTTIWEPATEAFKAGDDGRAIRILVDGFGGKPLFDNLPPESRTAAMQTSHFFKAAALSSNPFPSLSKLRSSD
jgi:hypothetical protein